MSKKTNKKTFNVHYSFYNGMLEREEIGNVLEMDLGDSNVWVD